jgi:hypothetical protein
LSTANIRHAQQAHDAGSASDAIGDQVRARSAIVALRSAPNTRVSLHCIQFCQHSLYVDVMEIYYACHDGHV